MKMQRILMLVALLALPVGAYAATLGNVTAGVARAMQMQGCEAAVNSTSTEQMFPLTGCFTPASAAAEGNTLQSIPIAGTVTNLNCYLTTAAGVKTVAGGAGYTLALRQNVTDSALTCTIGAAQMSCTDTTHSVTVAAADELEYSATPVTTPTALEAHCSALYAF